MADKNKSVIIIKKKKGGGHAGAHGGAWKVAYADFVTAMMAFFLVMWLLGSDEETKAAVSHYFNNPASPWRANLASDQTVPLGAKTAAGESVLKGLEGAYPEDVIETPSKPFTEPTDEAVVNETPNDPNLKNRIPGSEVNIEKLDFSMPEDLIFQNASDDFKPGAEKHLKQVGDLLKTYKRSLSIRGYMQPNHLAMPKGTDSYEFTMARVIAISRYLTKNNYADEDDISSLVEETRDVGQIPTVKYQNKTSGRIIDFSIQSK